VCVCGWVGVCVCGCGCGWDLHGDAVLTDFTRTHTLL